LGPRSIVEGAAEGGAGATFTGSGLNEKSLVVDDTTDAIELLKMSPQPPVDHFSYGFMSSDVENGPRLLAEDRRFERVDESKIDGMLARP